MQAGHEHQPGIHQIAMAPAPVALDFVQQIRRCLLVAALDVVGDPDAEARTPHQRRLDKVVREDFAG